MKLRYLTTLTLLTLVFALKPVQAANPAHVQQLRQTYVCANCDLKGADLRQTHLIGADLRNADLRGANLAGANLEGADLTGAKLNDANMTDAYLTEASLNHTNLTGVNFTRARIYHTEARGAIVKNVNLTNAQIHDTPINVGGDDGFLRH
jgi:uncharacterized protein YjbI with pentapeptide repeats